MGGIFSFPTEFGNQVDTARMTHNKRKEKQKKKEILARATKKMWSLYDHQKSYLTIKQMIPNTSKPIEQKQPDDQTINVMSVDLAQFRPQDKVKLMNELTIVVTTDYLKISNNLKKEGASLKQEEGTIAFLNSEIKGKDKKVEQLRKELKKAASK